MIIYNKKMSHRSFDNIIKSKVDVKASSSSTPRNPSHQRPALTLKNKLFLKSLGFNIK